MSDPIDLLRTELGDSVVLTDPADCAPFGTDWRGLYKHMPRAVLRPRDTAQAAACVTACARANIPIVPQGGNTSLVAGSVPSEAGAEIVLSLARLNRVRVVDPRNRCMVVEAGVTLKAAQEAASGANMLLPLSISSEGSAMIGGVIATNAGGNNTLRFGNARDLVLGLEVVLADGSIWHGLRRLRKDNTGFALRHVFAGSEGALGVITAATLKLASAPRARVAAFCGCPSVEAVLALFARLRDEDEAALYAFEYISAPALELHERHMTGFRLPLTRKAPHYALVELATTRRGDDLSGTLERVLADALEQGEIVDAAIAGAESQRLAFWALRENLAESQKHEGESVKNDISVPISVIPELLARAEVMIGDKFPGCRMVPFGHVGDGNIHLNIMAPPGEDAAFLGYSERLMAAVNEIVAGLDGSFSAEHGVGQIKRAAFARYRNATERDAMRRIKTALDPAGILNPGKIF